MQHAFDCNDCTDLLARLQFCGFKASMADVLPQLQSVMMVSRFKQMDRSEQPCSIPNPKKVPSYLHEGTQADVAAWNDGSALLPESDRLTERAAKIDVQTHRHLLDKPTAVRDFHRFGSTAAGTAAIALQLHVCS